MTAAQVAAARETAKPNSQGAAPRVFAVQEHGVNLYQAGRRNGPGTPSPDMKR
jgi:hypothetical protein